MFVVGGFEKGGGFLIADDAGRGENAWRLAGSVHGLLAGAKVGLGRQGCDVTPLLSS